MSFQETLSKMNEGLIRVQKNQLNQLPWYKFGQRAVLKRSIEHNEQDKGHLDLGLETEEMTFWIKLKAIFGY